MLSAAYISKDVQNFKENSIEELQGPGSPELRRRLPVCPHKMLNRVDKRKGPVSLPTTVHSLSFFLFSSPCPSDFGGLLFYWAAGEVPFLFSTFLTSWLLEGFGDLFLCSFPPLSSFWVMGEIEEGYTLFFLRERERELLLQIINWSPAGVWD